MTTVTGQDERVISSPPSRRPRRPCLLHQARIGPPVLAVVFGLTGAPPTDEAAESIVRIAPLLSFLRNVIVLPKPAMRARVFDVIATRLATIGGGSYLAPFPLCVGFASVTTVLPTLDTSWSPDCSWSSPR
ncbi:hypothetical protein FHR81_000140 [Actinoalloteichus hoggarensis]|uniref:Uncharacterized protein n=1 Tax=Actinoalloteichus hoggarensis TaxID=1470176 RepID=A0A221W369_9PSEU|nr:hypothetical protein [Actinoalloteichus hoggarensis]ASO20176.1 hypothetical protein AHOG_12665 [Actinoalloteichus hoggarensis]MBB5919111.1 hypothetical protein [Actinoalloteichus hoggarensis]